MKTGLYSLAELFGNRHIEQLVIPEIQRDYVWGKQQVEHLLNSILQNFKAWRQEQGSPSLVVVRKNPTTDEGARDNEVQSLQSEFAKFYARRIHATNVGFIYAYSDQDLPGQFFLIDGQQRLTTLYLTLLATAAKHKDLKERFQARYCLNNREPDAAKAWTPTRLDYRLREQTTQFLYQWVNHILESEEPPTQTKDQSWYLKRLDEDTTIESLLANYETIEVLLNQELSNGERSRFYEYLEDLVVCWYFDTNESAQGEELYIYLNARGESIADNENRKADLLATLDTPEEKEQWGRKWEEWQDYFWQKRNISKQKDSLNPNADRGFNSFLDCIENLEKLRAKGDSSSEPVDLAIIEQYVEILRWLEDRKEAFKSGYSYNKWVEKWFEELWSLFNRENEVAWPADVSDDKNSTPRNQMVLMWGTLLCVLLAKESGDDSVDSIDTTKVFRAIRVFYLRFHNNNRSVTSLEDTVTKLLDADPSAFANSDREIHEEEDKWTYLFNHPETERKDIESVIWKIEDHPLNLNGSDLGSQNLTHLLELKSKPTLEQLEAIRDNFYELFPEDQPRSDEKLIASILLYYGPYWNRKSPWYYENLNLGDWRPTIRGKGSAEHTSGNRTVFRQFFDEYLQAQQSLGDFAASKKNSEQLEHDKTETDLRKALVWYSVNLGSNFLNKGMYIAVDFPSEQRDAKFRQLGCIWNTKGDFRGNVGNIKLSKQYQRKLKHAKLNP